MAYSKGVGNIDSLDKRRKFLNDQLSHSGEPLRIRWRTEFIPQALDFKRQAADYDRTVLSNKLPENYHRSIEDGYHYVVPLDGENVIYDLEQILQTLKSIKSK